MYLLEFHKEAEKEYNEAYVWYGLQQEGLEERFRLAINEAVIQIQKNPEYFGYAKKPYREASVKIFPYAIVFKVNTIRLTIFISSIYHTSRNPKKKFRK